MGAMSSTLASRGYRKAAVQLFWTTAICVGRRGGGTARLRVRRPLATSTEPVPRGHRPRKFHGRVTEGAAGEVSGVVKMGRWRVYRARAGAGEEREREMDEAGGQ
jgi:hypothetical protein